MSIVINQPMRYNYSENKSKKNILIVPGLSCMTGNQVSVCKTK